VNDKLKRKLLKAAKVAHDKVTRAQIATLLPPGNKKQKNKFLKSSRELNLLLLERQLDAAPDSESDQILRQINNLPIKFARDLKDMFRILMPERRRGQEPLLSDNERREACQTFAVFRADGNTRKSAIEKTIKKFSNLTAQQMEGILRHKNRYSDV